MDVGGLHLLRKVLAGDAGGTSLLLMIWTLLPGHKIPPCLITNMLSAACKQILLAIPISGVLFAPLQLHLDLGNLTLTSGAY
jgi:hypothetical protein